MAQAKTEVALQFSERPSGRNHHWMMDEHLDVSGSGSLLPKFVPISFCRRASRFEVFQDAWRSNKENCSAHWNATLSCPLMASNYANSYLVPISFWMLTMLWIFLSRFKGSENCKVLVFL